MGANDGRIADPIHGFAAAHQDRVDLLLIEPQESLHSMLEESYGGHPSKTIVGRAVGPAGELKLFAVNPECWSDCSVPYADGWPSYRAPTGITSADYGHVEAWVQKYYVGSLPLSEVVVELTVPSTPLLPLLVDTGFGDSVDLLQIDTEGFDDTVIYESSIERLLPSVINFESRHLSGLRAKELTSYLQEFGFSIIANGGDTLAIRSRP
ncbi:FkbM family methyltransferase [Rhabdothermincola salaria]|uniref:FkbM family methyltransferase n=1 Tax=Rhabdothermincola salaria TaxID=2903142 RepID=UPI001E4C0B22|nr:FkbM family methyltransferase [Rhabdothermincola salaria]